jgi:hypothetical protein
MKSSSSSSGTYRVLPLCTVVLTKHRLDRGRCARQLLAQPDDLANGGIEEVGEGEQAQRVAGGGGVENDAREFLVLWGLDELDHLGDRHSLVET